MHNNVLICLCYLMRKRSVKLSLQWEARRLVVVGRVVGGDYALSPGRFQLAVAFRKTDHHLATAVFRAECTRFLAVRLGSITGRSTSPGFRQ